MDSSKDLNTNRTTKSAKSASGQRTLNKSASTSSKLNSSISGSQSANITDNQKNSPNKTKNLNESNTGNTNKTAINNNQLNGSGANSKSSNNNNNLNVLTTNKIPHPPPQTKPTTSSARKIRLSSAVKANNLLEQQQQQQQNVQSNINNNKLKATYTANKLNTGEISSNEEDIHNNSSKTLLDFNINSKQTDSPPSKNLNYSNTNYLNDSFGNANDLNQSFKTKEDNQQPISSNKLNDQSNTSYLKNTDMDLDGSSNSIVYSFSSRPKPVSVTNKEINTSINTNTTFTNNINNNNNTNKSYDYRKYTSSINKLPIQSNSSLLIAHLNKLETSNQFKDSLNISESDNLDQAPKNIIETNQNQLNYDVIDSFEARMLEDMKAEMDSNHNSNSSKKNSNGSKNQVSKSKLVEAKNMNGVESPSSKSPDKEKHKQLTNLINEHNYKLNQRSPDAEFIESLQREASGIQSPMSDDNYTTSEKYNFEAITSSIDDTTTSFSRRPSNMKTALDEINIYQEEMNVSLHTNIQSKSINYK